VKSPKNLVIALLVLTTIGGATVAWRQYQELIGLRAAALNKDERADLQARLWKAEQRAKDLENQLAARRNTAVANAEGGDAEETPAGETNTRRGRRGPGGPGGPGGLTNLMAVMERPEVQKLMAIQQKGQLDGRYAALFKNLNLSPEQLDKFKTLLVEKQTAMQDVMAAARAQGIDPREDPEGLRKMIHDTQAEVDNNIKELVGDAGFAQYQNYQQTMPQRSVVTQLQQSLSYTNAPLSDAQAEQLVQILAQTSPKNSQGGNRTETTGEINLGFAGGPPVQVAFTENSGGGGRGGGGDRFTSFAIGGGAFGGGNSAPITNEAINLAQSVLSAPQVQGLQQLQQQQQAQQQLQQTVRQSFGGGGRATTGNASGGAAPTAAPSSGKKG
jgi:hypothetical protein